MQHEKFEARLHEVLDQRQRLESDAELASLADASPQAAEELALYEALLDGLDARQIPDPPADLADRVVHHVNRRGSSASHWIWPGVALAVAATLLLALLPQLLGPAGAPPADQPNVVATPNADAQKTPLPNDPFADASPANQIVLDEYSMLRLTGEAMQAVRTTVVVNDDNMVIEGMRPVASSLSAALDALRGTLPRKNLDSKSSYLVHAGDHMLA